MKKNNILLIHSDQHRFDCLGCNGHALVKTPNIDRLATEGVNFTHAFTPTPICSPERASLLTGQWPIQHSCLSIPGTEVYSPAKSDLPIFSKLLQEDGYKTGFVGKFHQELEGIPTNLGFDEFVCEYSYDNWRKNAELPPRPKENKWFGEIDPEITPEQSRMAWEVDNVIRMLTEYNATCKPFMIRWDPSEPHLPNIVPEPYFSMYPPDEIAPWRNYKDELAGKPYIQSQQRRTWKVDDWTWKNWSPIVSRYLGEISLMDTQIGRILDTLDKLKISNNTLVVYTSDHGDMCGAHGMIDKHFVMYDDVVRVPLIARFPGILPQGQKCDHFISHAIDLASTFLDVAKITPPSTFKGCSLIKKFCNNSKDHRQDIFSMWHGGQFGSYSQRMVRNRQWKYIWNCSAEDELYNLVDDPGEIKNLATCTSSSGILQYLRQRLVCWMKATDDILLNQWNESQLLDGLTK